MNLLFAALGLIALGGLLPFALLRNFRLMKAAAAAFIVAGGG